FQFLCGTGGFYGDCIGGNVHHVGPEEFNSLDYGCTGGSIGANLDQDVVALGGLIRYEFNDFDDVDQFIELFGNVLCGVAFGIVYDGHARVDLDYRYAFGASYVIDL